MCSGVTPKFHVSGFFGGQWSVDSSMAYQLGDSENLVLINPATSWQLGLIKLTISNLPTTISELIWQISPN
jgi:hypothetical protein